MGVKLNRPFRMGWILLVATLSISAVEISNIGQAIDIAGKQRMFSFRILKDYLMIAMESEYKNPKQDMEESLKDFEEAESALKTFAKDPKIKPLFAKVDKDFATLKLMVSKPFIKAEGESYYAQTAMLRSAAHKGVLALQEQSGEASAEVINKMGRLRSVSQKINAIYLLKTMGIESEKINKGMQRAMKTFKESLDFLLKAELMDADMQKKLKKLTKIYQFFQIMNASDNYVPTIISKKSDKMLKYADELTLSYLKQKK